MIEKSCIELSKLNNVRVWLSLDGPRSLIEKKVIDECEKITSKILKNSLQDIRRSEYNLGCKNSVEAGITWFFKNVKSGIICEDDIIISENCISNLKEILNHHNGILPKNICHISFYRPILTKERLDNKWSVSNTAFVWGWFTTADKWQRHLDLWSQKNVLDKMKFVNFFEVSRKSTKRRLRNLLDVAAKKVDTWDWNWQASMRFYCENSLVPPRNLSKNIGTASGSHAKFRFASIENIKLNSISYSGVDMSLCEDFDRIFLKLYFNSKYQTIINEIKYRIFNNVT